MAYEWGEAVLYRGEAFTYLDSEVRGSVRFAILERIGEGNGDRFIYARAGDLERIEEKGAKDNGGK